MERSVRDRGKLAKPCKLYQGLSCCDKLWLYWEDFAEANIWKFSTSAFPAGHIQPMHALSYAKLAFDIHEKGNVSGPLLACEESPTSEIASWNSSTQEFSNSSVSAMLYPSNWESSVANCRVQ